MKHVAASNGVAVDHGYDGLYERADSLVDVEHVKARSAVAVAIAAVGLVVLVAARAESFVADTCEDDNAYFRGVAAVCEASSICAFVCGRKALYTSGRLMLILAMPSKNSKRMSEYSLIVFHSLAGACWLLFIIVDFDF